MEAAIGVNKQDLLSLVGRDGQLKRVASTKGGEYAGPCPFCGGTDRFRVWPDHPSGTARWKCMGHEEGRAGCGRGGDAIAYLVEHGNISPAEAGRLRRGGSWSETPRPGTPRTLRPERPKPSYPPGPEWQRAAGAFAARAQEQLWSDGDALAWLYTRGLTDETIREARLGWNPADLRRDPRKWGFPGGKAVWLPRGWVIPWEIAGELWQVSIRQPEGTPKYVMVKGSKHALYNADALDSNRPAILCEGVFDVLSIVQVAGDVVTPVAAGSTTGARDMRWIAKLAMCSQVLVSFDAEVDKGDKAAAWWVDVLENAKRWRPLWGDANAMAQAGVDLRTWIVTGLEGVNLADADGDSVEKLRAILQELHPTTPETQLAWCRRYAFWAARAGWPCTDSPSWKDWLAKLEADFTSKQDSQAAA